MTHTLYVAAAYGISAVVLLGLGIWLAVDSAARRRELADLESRGIRRRSERPR